jgi:hypothetical protein
MCGVCGIDYVKANGYSLLHRAPRLFLCEVSSLPKCEGIAYPGHRAPADQLKLIWALIFRIAILRARIGKRIQLNFTFMWPCCIVTNLFVIKPTRCANFPNLLRHETLHVSGSSFRAGPGWSCSKAVYKPVWHIPVPSVQWINSWWWAEELPETCRVSCRSKYGKLVHLVVLL